MEHCQGCGVTLDRKSMVAIILDCQQLYVLSSCQAFISIFEPSFNIAYSGGSFPEHVFFLSSWFILTTCMCLCVGVCTWWQRLEGLDPVDLESQVVMSHPLWEPNSGLCQKSVCPARWGSLLPPSLDSHTWLALHDLPPTLCHFPAASPSEYPAFSFLLPSPCSFLKSSFPSLFLGPYHLPYAFPHKYICRNV